MNVAFAEQLKAWGPESASGRLSRKEAEAYCRALARTHYENFPVVSWLLPRRLHQHFFNVYAYCRWADDLGDEVGDASRACELLAWWRQELESCYRGEATHPVFIALGPTIEEFAIPRQPFEDLLSAFEQDQHVREYESFEALRDYCRRSADPVGRIDSLFVRLVFGPECRLVRLDLHGSAIGQFLAGCRARFRHRPRVSSPGVPSAFRLHG